jgi:hypothetical protein
MYRRAGILVFLIALFGIAMLTGLLETAPHPVTAWQPQPHQPDAKQIAGYKKVFWVKWEKDIWQALEADDVVVSVNWHGKSSHSTPRSYRPLNEMLDERVDGAGWLGGGADYRHWEISMLVKKAKRLGKLVPGLVNYEIACQAAESLDVQPNDLWAQTLTLPPHAKRMLLVAPSIEAANRGYVEQSDHFTVFRVPQELVK